MRMRNSRKEAYVATVNLALLCIHSVSLECFGGSYGRDVSVVVWSSPWSLSSADRWRGYVLAALAIRVMVAIDHNADFIEAMEVLIVPVIFGECAA